MKSDGREERSVRHPVLLRFPMLTVYCTAGFLNNLTVSSFSNAQMV